MKWSDLLERLVALRKERRLSQAALAEKLGSSKQWLNNVEAGRRWNESSVNFERLARWASELDHEIVVELVPRGWVVTSAPAARGALWSALTDDDRQLVEKLARVLPHLDSVARRGLIALLDSYEDSLADSQSNGSPGALPLAAEPEDPPYGRRSRHRG